MSRTAGAAVLVADRAGWSNNKKTGSQILFSLYNPRPGGRNGNPLAGRSKSNQHRMTGSPRGGKTVKRTISIALASLIVLALSVVLWPLRGSRTQAASDCKNFEAIAQASLPYDLAHGAPWGGPLSGWLGGAPLFGRFFGNDGETIFRQKMGMGKGGVYTFCAGNTSCDDSFTWQVPNAVFIGGPGAIGAYIGNTAKIVSGTGAFVGATGNLNVNGPASTWPNAASPIGVIGAWNAQLSGKICGIE